MTYMDVAKCETNNYCLNSTSVSQTSAAAKGTTLPSPRGNGNQGVFIVAKERRLVIAVLQESTTSSKDTANGSSRLLWQPARAPLTPRLRRRPAMPLREPRRVVIRIV